jgi:hypothetical protein
MLPSLLELEVMYVIFSTPLIDCSNGVATERATTSALAPGYDAVTTTLGGAISGNKVTGKVYKDIAPSNNNIIETTVDKTGRSINLFSIEYKVF